MMTRSKTPTQFLLHGYLFFVLFVAHLSSSQKTCPNCGSIQVPYPLSTSSNCGDPDYAIRCEARTKRLFFDALNGSSHLILSIQASMQRMVLQPSPWVPQKCVTQDMQVSEGFWLNQMLPFNITSSNTVFLFNCSPRLLVSPLNCTSASLCHRYLEESGHVDPSRSAQCATELNLCCTFIAGGMPSAYKIRLHASGCQAFRSIIHLNSETSAREWEEGLEVQWAPPPEPVCKTQLDCSRTSTCSTTGKLGMSRCLCIKSYYWDHALGACSKKPNHSRTGLGLKLGIGIFAFVALAVAMTFIRLKISSRFSHQLKLTKAREEMLKAGNGWKSARMFSLKEVKKATFRFSPERILGSGGFGEVYKGELQDGTVVAIKSAKVGNIKSTQQVLNEVEILSQVNHRHLVRLLGCCIEAEQPLLIYEYIPNGTLHDHLHNKSGGAFLDLKSRLRIAIQTAEALAYLHSSACTPIYHRDVKSTNILLDEELNAKVSDFGISRLAQPGLSHVSTCAQGTIGYLDPEYYRNYQLTDKSDVYSYGVVLLELLTSQKAIDFSRDHDEVNLAMYVTLNAKNGTVMDIVDQNLVADGPSSIETAVTSMNLLAELALSCLKEKKGERPSMKDVVEKLQFILDTLYQKD